uniref:Uncharacterized protein n=2 Tax=Graphocephala atropunctata TaxID=36148 RepID=A0A1B6LG62_9HEMI
MILGHVPAGTSTKTLVHYAQEIKSRMFQKYDYGAERNIILYNSTTPPLYNLSQVTVPVSLHYGDNDLLASPTDVSTLFSQLKSAVGMFRVNLSSFNHLDFLWGRDARSLVYTTVQTLMGEYSSPAVHLPARAPASVSSATGVKSSFNVLTQWRNSDNVNNNAIE